MLTHQEMVTRIAVGALLGACIGYERTQHGRALGLRTHMLVALAAATFMLISSQFVFYQGYTSDTAGKLVQVDTSRIASTVVSGIGFLAGGAIIRSGGHVQNLTSAAGLWLVTAIGMCAGAAMYVEAVFATALGLFSLRVVRWLEDKSTFPIRGRMVLAERGRLAEVCKFLEQQGLIVFGVEDDGQGTLTVRFELKRAMEKSLVAIVHELEAAPGVKAVSVERSS